LKEIDKKLVKGVIGFEVMKILWSGPTQVKDIRKKLLKTLEIGVDSETITKILELMERNGYIRSSTGSRKSYVLTGEGNFLFEDTQKALGLLNNLPLNIEKLAKWISLHLTSRTISISEQLIENSIRNYLAEETLREYLKIT